MAKSITLIQITDTFQTWLNKTNQLIGLVNTDIMTASSVGDTTIGNAELVGDFKASTLEAVTETTTETINVSTIRQNVGSSDPIEVLDVFELQSSSQYPLVLNNTTGPRIRMQTAADTWDVGLLNSTANSPLNIYHSSDLTPAVSITTAGGVTAKGIIAATAITATANGTAGAPAVRFTSDADTGMFTPAADNISFAVGGLEAIRITNSRHLRIVNSSGQVRIQNGSLSFPGLAFDADNDTGVIGFGSNSFGFVVGGTEAFRIDANRNLTGAANSRILAQSGTLAAPSYGFAADLDTGFALDSARLSVITDGVKRLDFGSVAGSAAANAINMYPTPTGATARLDTPAAGLDINTYHSNGLRLGREAGTTAKVTIFEPGTTNARVQLETTGSVGSVMVSSPTTVAATRPAYSFVSDTDTGISAIAANTLNFITGGTQKLEITDIAINSAVGMTFGATAAADRADLSRHIALFGSTYGIGVSSSSLNLVAPATAGIRFVNQSDATIRMTVGSNSILAAIPIEATSFTSSVGGNSFLAPTTDSAAAPSFSWTGDPDSGMWRASANAIGFATAGTNRLTIGQATITAAAGVRFAGDGSGLTDLDASNFASGTIPTTRISGAYSGIVGTGALNSGSITSGFGNINIGSSTFTGNGGGLVNLNASELADGTIPVARLGTSTSYRDWVLARTAQTGVGAVGTYAYLALGGAISPNNTYSGSSLFYAGVKQSSGASDVSRSGGSPSGTWRAMGGCANDNDTSTLFLRIS